MDMNINLTDTEVFFLKRALLWRIQNIDYFIEKRKLTGLKKANQLSEKATLEGILKMIENLESRNCFWQVDDDTSEPVDEANGTDEE